MNNIIQFLIQPLGGEVQHGRWIWLFLNLQAWKKHRFIFIFKLIFFSKPAFVWAQYIYKDLYIRFVQWIIVILFSLFCLPFFNLWTITPDTKQNPVIHENSYFLLYDFCCWMFCLVRKAILHKFLGLLDSKSRRLHVTLSSMRSKHIFLDAQLYSITFCKTGFR